MNDDVIAVRKAAYEGMARVLPDERRQDLLAQPDRWDDLTREFGDLGWFSLVVPEADSGMGLPLGVLGGLLRTVGEHVAPGHFVEQCLVPGLLLSDVGAAPDRIWRESLQACTGGAGLVAVAGLDPTMASSADVPAEVASGTVDGSFHLVRGVAQATCFLVAAQEAGEPILLVVDRVHNGVEVGDIESLDPCSAFGFLTLRSVKFAAGQVVARGENAVRLSESLVAWFRILSAAELAGLARSAIDRTVQYTKERVQFDRPIASFQAIKHIAADMEQRVAVLESFCDAVCDDAASLDHQDLVVIAAAAKARASEVGREVCESAVQLHGGIGFTWEYPLHWYYKRALALEPWAGDADELLTFIGRHRLMT